YSVDPDQQRTVLQSIYEQSPPHFLSALKAGLDLARAKNPDFIAPLVGERLENDQVWDWLEEVHAAAVRSGHQVVANLLNSFAGIFTKYGLGPQLNETGEAAERRHDFNSEVSRTAESALNAAIAFRLEKLMPPGSNGAH